MADIASLGLSIDSKPAATAADDLTKLSQAAKTAETGVKALEQTTVKAGAAVAGMSKNIQSALNSADNINRRLNVRDTFGGADRAADVASYGAELDRLRAKISPLFAVQQSYKASLDEISMAARVGAISEQEKTAAISRAEIAYTRQTRAVALNEQQIQKSGKAALVSGYQYQNLAFQLNDVATMAAMGMDPLRILTSQGGQFYQVLAMTEGGPVSALKEIGTGLLGLVNPFNVAVTAAVAFGAAAIAAAASWSSGQRDIRNALIGVGGAAGMTVDDINAIAYAANAAGDATVGQARDMAVTFASTGKIGKEITTELIGLGRDMARVYGEDLTEATDRLASSFADPAKGVLELNKRLGAFDDKTLQNIRTLANHGERLAAQRLLFDSLKDSIDGAATSASVWSRAWNAVSQAASGFWAKMGEQIDRSLGGGSLAQQIEDTKRSIKSLQDSNIYGTLGPYIDREEAKLRALNAQLDVTAEKARKADVNLRAMSAVDIAQRVSPDLNQRSAMEGDLAIMRQTLNDQQQFNSLSDANKETLTRSVQALQTKVRWHKTDFELSMEQNSFETRALSVRTVQEKSQLAFEQTLSQLRRQGLPEVEALILATMARNKVEKEGAEQTKQFIRERTFNQAQSIDQIELETKLIGKSTSEAAGLRAEWEAISEAKRRAFENGTSITQGDIDNARGFGADSRGASMGREARQLEQDQKSPSELLSDEMDRLNELRNTDLISHQTYLGAKNAAEYQYFQTTQQILSNERAAREQTVSLAAGLLDQFAGKSKAAAIAAIALNKATQIANTIMNTTAAAAAALAPPPLGLGPIAGAPVAASIQAWGAAQVGIIAATGLAQAFSSGKSGSPTTNRAGGGSASAPSNVLPAGPQVNQQSIQITLLGSRYTREEVRELLEVVNENIRDGTRFEVN